MGKAQDSTRRPGFRSLASPKARLKSAEKEVMLFTFMEALLHFSQCSAIFHSHHCGKFAPFTSIFFQHLSTIGNKTCVQETLLLRLFLLPYKAVSLQGRLSISQYPCTALDTILTCHCDTNTDGKF